jgi:hypothetical protein
LTTSMGFADAVAGILGEDPDRIRLHLKTIRRAGEITFKGYGRGAAAMTALDAARLVIAVAGSSAAKHAAETLEQFRELRPLSKKGRGLSLESFLTEHISRLAKERLYPRRPVHGGRPKYNRSAEQALKLIWCAGLSKDSLPRLAVVRWFRLDGGADAAAFASEPMPFPLVDEARLAEFVPEAGIIRSGAVTARALLEIACAL